MISWLSPFVFRIILTGWTFQMFTESSAECSGCVLPHPDVARYVLDVARSYKMRHSTDRLDCVYNCIYIYIILWYVYFSIFFGTENHGDETGQFGRNEGQGFGSYACKIEKEWMKGWEMMLAKDENDGPFNQIWNEELHRSRSWFQSSSSRSSFEHCCPYV